MSERLVRFTAKTGKISDSRIKPPDCKLLSNPRKQQRHSVEPDVVTGVLSQPTNNEEAKKGSEKERPSRRVRDSRSDSRSRVSRSAPPPNHTFNKNRSQHGSGFEESEGRISVEREGRRRRRASKRTNPFPKRESSATSLPSSCLTSRVIDSTKT